MYNKIKKNLIEIINNPFGNYLIQKMISKLNNYNMKHFLEIIINNFLLISKNPQGTRVIQKLIEFSNDINLINNIIKNTLQLLKDNNGYHIILKFAILNNRLNEIEKIIQENLLEISTNKFGCCAIQKYLQNYPEEKIINAIIFSTEKLIINIYGNYVIQYIISLNNKNYNHLIVDKLKSNIIYLSKQKFSSNVIERCFDYCEYPIKLILINHLCEEKVVKELLFDMYGNYGKNFKNLYLFSSFTKSNIILKRAFFFKIY